MGFRLRMPLRGESTRYWDLPLPQCRAARAAGRALCILGDGCAAGRRRYPNPGRRLRSSMLSGLLRPLVRAAGPRARRSRRRGGAVMATTVGRPRPSAAVVAQSVAVRRPPPPGRRPPAPGSPPLGASSPSTPFAVRSWGLDEHRELPVGRRRRQSVPADGADTPAMKSSFAITASSRSSSSAIFSPTRPQRAATPRRW